MATLGLFGLFFVFNIFRGACLLLMLLNRCKNLLRLSFGSADVKTEVHISFLKSFRKACLLNFLKSLYSIVLGKIGV